MSVCLARRLGIDPTMERPCYVLEDLGVLNVDAQTCPVTAPARWYILRAPLAVANAEPMLVPVPTAAITPVINSGSSCVWDLILGQDYHAAVGADALFEAIFSRPAPVHTPPTPGPNFEKPGQRRYLGHHVRVCCAEELPLAKIDAFVEYTLELSTTVRRICVNKMKKMLAVAFTGDDTIYVYDNVPDPLLDMVRDNFETAGRVLAGIKKLKPVAQLEDFPDTLFCTRFGTRYPLPSHPVPTFNRFFCFFCFVVSFFLPCIRSRRAP